MTTEELQSKCEYWQKVLRLQDWEVQVFVCGDCEMNGGWGRCIPTALEKSAVIKVMNPIDQASDSKHTYDPEETLVHELLHLHYDSFMAERDTLEYIAQEQSINLIAAALVALNRK